MEILYVIVGGLLVVAGYMLGNQRKNEHQPEAKPEPEHAVEQAEVPAVLPKSGIPEDEQVANLMGYNPYKARKNGDKA